MARPYAIGLFDRRSMCSRIHGSAHRHVGPAIAAVLLVLLVCGSTAAQVTEPLPEPGPPELGFRSDSECDRRCKLLRPRPISQLTVDIQPRSLAEVPTVLTEEDLPQDCSGCFAPARPIQPASVPLERVAFWPNHFQAGAAFWHPPLYFEDKCLERCGYADSLSPARSAAHFLLSTVTLPFKAVWRHF